MKTRISARGSESIKVKQYDEEPQENDCGIIGTSRRNVVDRDGGNLRRRREWIQVALTISANVTNSKNFPSFSDNLVCLFKPDCP